MIELYVLDEDLKTVWQVDSYNSLIWSNRYWETGDCEIYLPATVEALNYLRKGYFLVRPDDEMICRINYIELDTDAENGNYLIVKGVDAKSFLDQRVIEGVYNVNGIAETFARSLVLESLGSTADADRQIQDENGNCIFTLADAAGFTDEINEDVSFKIVGEKIREYCNRFGWGYKVTLENGSFVFYLYKGVDRSGYVAFTPEYENIITSKYIEDATGIGNAAYFAGAGEGAERPTGTSGGTETGKDRYEIFVDAKGISRTTTWGELKKAYPDAIVYHPYVADPTDAVYLVEAHLAIINDEYLSWLQNNYPNGHIITIDNVEYYELYILKIATIGNKTADTITDEDNVEILDVIYLPTLYSKGFDELAKHPETKTFEGVVEPNTTFQYKDDYFLGDIVRVENEYGISIDARIVEIVEVEDDTGYNVEPKFEYKIMGE